MEVPRHVPSRWEVTVGWEGNACETVSVGMYMCANVYSVLQWMMFRLNPVEHSLPSPVLPPSGWSHPDRNLSLSHWFCWNLSVRSNHPSGPVSVREIFNITRQHWLRRFHPSLAKTGEIHNSLKHTAHLQAGHKSRNSSHSHTEIKHNIPHTDGDKDTFRSVFLGLLWVLAYF